MIKCCGTFDAGYCPWHHPHFVSFDNLEKKYSVNEDIHVEYTLRGHVQQASTRDWLGIFPRGWTNLQQYLTFEYALVAPRAASSSNRTIIFPHVFHQEASTSTEYQLVYVSREIQVLATSSYFRFIRDETTDAENHVLHFPCGVRKAPCSGNQEINSDQLPNSGWAPPRIVLSDQSLLSLHPSRTASTNPRLPRICRTCGRPRDNYACGIAAGRARSSAAHSASLAERAIRLEHDLILAESSKCSLAERLHAYENFVSEMLRSLASKRIVKITDANGKEIIVQQLPITTESEVKVTDESKASGKDIGQEDASNLETNDSSVKKICTNDRGLDGEYLPEEKTILTLKDDQGAEETPRELIEDFKNDAHVIERERTSTNVETQTESGIDVKFAGCQNYEDSITMAGYNGEHDKCAIVEGSTSLEPNVSDEELEHKKSVEKGGWTEDGTEKSNMVPEDGSKALQSKPSAIVIQGSNVKFAIIRY